MQGHAPPRPVGRGFNSILTGLPTTIFEVMSGLSRECKSVNLGQGFPDDELEGPASMKSGVASALTDHTNQYPPMMGLPELRRAVAAHSGRCAGLTLADWPRETLVTAGATEALAAAFLGLLNPGEEVILFEPLYDSYLPMVRRAGAVPVVVPLQPPGWGYDAAALAAAFSPKTALLVLNSPHNPTGKVFSAAELGTVAELVLAHGNCRVVLDEVYEHLVFPGTRHMSLRALPGMAGRCLRVGSAGKTFSFTGWKVGWATGPADMIGAVAAAHQFLTFTVAPALQRAVALGLDSEQGFYTGLGAALQRRREYLAARLSAIGFDVLPAQGTYFLVADFAPLLAPAAAGEEGEAAEGEGDVAFCLRLTRQAGVTLIPVSAFYLASPAAGASAGAASGSGSAGSGAASRPPPPRTLVRFVFCKSDEKLALACDKLAAYFAPGAEAARRRLRQGSGEA